MTGATTPSGGRGRTAPQTAEGSLLTPLIIGGAAAIALALSLYQLARPGMLFGVTEYDDGAYFGSAIRLVNGALPYRDFVLVQPPGFTLLASPLALLSRVIGTRDAFAVARLFLPVVAVLNVVLVGLLVRHRGQLATMVATGLMAVFPAEVHATHTLLLEPLLDLFCLAGAVLVFEGERIGTSTRNLLLGGIAFGFAGTIKGWAVVAVLVLALLCLPQVRRRLAPLLGGVALGFAVPTVPFALMAPGSFYREVISTQLGRIAGSGRVASITRLGDLTGSTSLTPGSPSSRPLSIVVAVALVALVVVSAVRLRRRPSEFEWFITASMVGVAALLMAPAEFYDHYAAFFAPFAALVAGSAIGVLARRPRPAAALAVAGLAVVALAANQVRIVGGERGGDLSRTVGAVIPSGACALSDSAAYLITVDRFVSSRPGCADYVTDAYGTTISYGGRTPASVAVWLHALENADYLVVYSLRNGRIPLLAPLRAELADDFRAVPAGNLTVFVRDGLPTG